MYLPDHLLILIIQQCGGFVHSDYTSSMCENADSVRPCLLSLPPSSIVGPLHTYLVFSMDLCIVAHCFPWCTCIPRPLIYTCTLLLRSPCRVSQSGHHSQSFHLVRAASIAWTPSFGSAWYCKHLCLPRSFE